MTSNDFKIGKVTSTSNDFEVHSVYSTRSKAEMQRDWAAFFGQEKTEEKAKKKEKKEKKITSRWEL